jgi:predicted  nucleic acid-binding Zn-ribbon protein
MLDPQSANTVEVTIITLKTELRAVKGEIAERNQYRGEQERIITDLIDQGNMRLLELNYDIKLAKQTLRDLKTDIRTAAQDRELVRDDLESLKNEVKNLYGNSGLALSGM